MLVILIMFSLAMTAFFEGAETALISANRVRFRTMAENGDRRARRIVKLFDKPSRLLGVTLVGSNLFSSASTVIASILIGLLFNQFTEQKYQSLQNLVTVIVMTPILLIFTQIIPKAVGRARANSISLGISSMIRFFSFLLYPIASPIGKIGTSIAVLFGRNNVANDTIAMEELKILAKLGEKDGAIRPQQSKMINSIFEIREKTLSKIMIPLVDVVSVDKDITLKEFYNKISKNKFSRIPVYSERTDNITGIVNVLDVLYSDAQSGTIRPFIHEDIIYLPESKRITSSLEELQKSPHPMGIVVDEYGGVVGIVTMEDIIAEIVGEIKDDWEEDKKPKFDGKTLECDGRTEIDEINELLGTDIPSEEYETIAGFIIDQMDKIPRSLEETRWKNIKMVVLRSNKRSVL
ncbi:MAG: hemolysin family protein, partial [Candidatus Poribacteria bacterium]